MLQDSLSNSVRLLVKESGLMDTAENCWEFFINQVRANLHVCLCFSPVGEKFRGWARKVCPTVHATGLSLSSQPSSAARRLTSSIPGRTTLSVARVPLLRALTCRAVSVAARFLQDLDLSAVGDAEQPAASPGGDGGAATAQSEELRDSLHMHVALVHESVTAQSERFRVEANR